VPRRWCWRRSAYGLVGGVAAGVLGGLALRLAARRGSIEPHWVQILTVSSALLAAGVATGLGGSIFIAAFTAGFVFGVSRPDRGAEVTDLVAEGASCSTPSRSSSSAR
jgi:sodium/hydrogen antiporter